MGDGIKAMYDDFDDYTDLCEKYGIKPICGPVGNYSLHERWIKERFEQSKTTLEWSQYLDEDVKHQNRKKALMLLKEAVQLLAESQS